MAKRKIKAYSANVSDYPSVMSGWEKESLSAEAKLRDARKSKVVLVTKTSRLKKNSK
jgi:hypothetical protein